jgi:hypothetical protein
VVLPRDTTSKRVDQKITSHGEASQRKDKNMITARPEELQLIDARSEDDPTLRARFNPSVQ